MDSSRLMLLEYRREKPGYIALIVITPVLFVVTLVFNFLNQVAPENDLFKNTPGNLSDKYSLDITPAGWTFSIWGFIYAAQALWLIYSVTLICRINKFNKGKLYYDPPFLPPTFFTIYCMNLILNVLWLLTFDSEYLVASFLALLGVYLTNLLCLFFSFKLLWDFELELGKAEMWLNIILVQNGLGLYAAWTAVATLLNLGIVLRYQVSNPVAMDTTCYILLVALLAQFLLYIFSDTFVARKRLRYFFTPYLVLIVALSGVIDKNWDGGDSGVQIFVVVLLGVVCLGLVGKIVSVVYNYNKQPISIEQFDEE